MADSNTDDMPSLLSIDNGMSLEDYFATNSYTNGLDSNMTDEPWKEVSDGSDSGIDSKYCVQIL